MKIVCDSCGAKYSIADEKVAGKVFKIRCKKCSAVIVVRGDQVPAAQDESTAVYDYQQEGGGGGAPAAAGAPDAVWHVVVNGDQQGPFAPADIGGMLSAGTIDWEAYVWREGFGDWMPARDVQELVDAIMGGAPQAAEQPAADAYGGGGAAAGYAAADPGGGLFAASSADAAFSGGGGGYGGGADLFAKQDAGSSPFEGSDDDVVASTPSPRVAGDQAMTGQRNENSVLFSLANLQALATGPGASPAASPGPMAQAKAGHASGEGSGLIDIRSLATATGVGGGPAMAPMAGGGGGKKDNVDDLLSIGTGPALGGLGAPVLAPVQEEKSNRGLIIAIAAAAGVMAIAAVAVIAVVVSKEPEPVAQASGAPVATGTGAIAPGAGTEPAGTGTAPAGTQGAGSPAGTEGAATAGMTEETEEEGEEGEEDEGSSAGSRPRSGSGRPRSGSSMSGTTTAAMESEPEAAPVMRGSGDIDDLLEAALGGMQAAMSATPAMTAGGGGADLADTPSRDEVGRALRSVQGAVSACGQGQHGVAMTAITVSGSTGRVTNAQVSGQFAGTPVGSCVARAVRGAQFSRFRRPTFNVSFPYRI